MHWRHGAATGNHNIRHVNNNFGKPDRVWWYWCAISAVVRLVQYRLVSCLFEANIPWNPKNEVCNHMSGIDKNGLVIRNRMQSWYIELSSPGLPNLFFQCLLFWLQHHHQFQLWIVWAEIRAVLMGKTAPLVPPVLPLHSRGCTSNCLFTS